MRRSNENKRQRLLVIAVTVMALMLGVSLAACGGSSDGETATGQTEPTVTEQMESTETAEISADKEKEKAKEEAEKQTEEKKATESESAENVQPSQAGAKTKSDNNKATKESKEKDDKVKPTKKKKQVCYITIEGYCSSKEITLQSGDTVYDILKRSGALVSARSTGYGIYVEAINGLAEFDKGPTSGWKYSVNGAEPGNSCDACAVKSGDKINWYYALEV